MLRTLFPERCSNCGSPGGESLCGTCRRTLRTIRNPCPGCGLGKPVRRCPRVLIQPWLVSTMVAPLRYEPPLDGYLQALKFHHNRRMGRALGLLLAEHLMDSHNRGTSVDAIVPVPLHRQRLRGRGFNQALEIARPVAAASRFPVLSTGVRRCLRTPPQTLMQTSRRPANVRGAFDVRRRLNGLVLAIVDDVITTGATVNALALALHEAGAAEVHAWAVGRAPPALND